MMTKIILSVILFSSIALAQLSGGGVYIKDQTTGTPVSITGTSLDVHCTGGCSGGGGGGDVNVHDGVGNSISSTTGSLNVNVTNSSGLSTVDQGAAGTDPWLFHFNNTDIGRTWTLDSSTDNVAIVGTVTVDASGHTVPVSGPLTDTQLRASSVPVTANAGTNLNTSALNLESTQSAFKTANHSDLSAINTTLGSPFQSGGSIGNTSFACTQGTAANLNATVVGPSGVALAKDSSLSTINTTLGTPFQAGGSIGNTAFTANAGTNLNTSALNLESTQSGFKSANHTDLGAINTTLGTPFQAGGSIGNTSFIANAGTNLNTSALALDTSVGTTNTRLSTINTTLGSPFQAGGSIANTSFIGTLLDTTQTTSITTDPANVDFDCTNLNAMRFHVSISGSQTCNMVAKTLTGSTFEEAFFFDNIELLSNGQLTGSGFSLTGIYDVSCAGYKTVEFQCTGATGGSPIVFEFRANPSASRNVNIMGGYITEVAQIDALPLPSNAAKETGGNLDNIETHASSIDTKLTTTNSSLSTIATNTSTTATNVAATQVAQASTTSGQNGNLVQMATTTAHPTYTTAKTNPLSSDVNGNLRVSLADSTMPSTPVTGTFWQTTQPVSGTFWQTTQPVSIASLPALTAGSAVIGHVITDSSSVTNATLSAETTKVIGTVNVAASQTIGLAAGSAVIGHVINDASSAVIGHVIVDTAPTTAVTGTFFQATQPVSIATAPVLVAGSAIIGKVGIDQTTPGTTNLVALAANQTVNVAQINGVTPLMGNGVTGTGSQRVTIASDNTAFSVNDVPPTLTKGTQGSTGFSVQELKDAGRNQFRLYATAVAAGTTTTETIFTLTKSFGTAATATATTYTPTSGKKFRITSIEGASRGNTTATAQVTTFNIRVNTAGACVVTSTPIIYSFRTATPATSFAYDRFAIQGMEGDEITGDGTLSICVSANAVYTTNAPTWDFILTGYEY